MKIPQRLLWILFLLLPAALPAQSQLKADLRTPYNAVYTHLYYLQPDTYRPDRAARPIQGVNDKEEAKALAIKLKQILDGKGLRVDISAIPEDADYRDSLSGKNQFILFPNELPEVYLQKIGDSWYYSSQTIARIPELHKQVYPFGSDILVKLIPHQYGQHRFLGLAVWQYLGILILALITWVIHFFLSRLLRPIVERLSRSKRFPATTPTQLVISIARLISIFMLILAWKWVTPLLQLPVDWVSFVMTGTGIAGAVIFILLSLRILDVVILYFRKYTAGTQSQLDDQLVPIIKRMVQLTIVIVGVFQVLHLLSVNVTALIAGVSIGGLALALAAQDTVKNLIGSAMIFFDRPFQIGDWIIGDTFEGKVVEVGFRTTRIEAVDSSIVAVPNGNIANLSVRNLGVRVYRLLDARLGIAYNTPPEKIEWFIEGLKQIILAHPLTLNEGYRVHFFAMGDFSLTIMYRALIQTNDYGDELKIKDDLYLAALRLAAALGVEFAFPTTTIHVESFPGQERPPAKPGPRSPEEAETALAGFMQDFEARVARPAPPDEAL
jgi:MscS family membrane protein